MSADIKAIVFDFGQVVGVFDHRVTTNRLVSYATLSADELHGRLFGTALEDDYESGRLTTEQFLHAVRESCRLSCSEAFLATAWADIFLPNPEVCALIRRLKPHYRLLLASNTNELHSRQFMRQFAEVLGRYVRSLPLGRWLLGSVLGARDILEDPHGAAERYPVFELHMQARSQ